MGPPPSTAVAPWDVVPSTDINYKTWHVFATIIRRLETALDETPASLPTYAELSALGQGKKASKHRRKQAPAAAESGGDGDQAVASKSKSKSKSKPKSKSKRKQAAAAESAAEESAAAREPAPDGELEMPTALEETDA